MFDQRDRTILMRLTTSIMELTNVLKNKAEPNSFHQRQVPALQRQSNAIYHIKEVKREYLKLGLDTQLNPKHIINVLEEIEKKLIST